MRLIGAVLLEATDEWQLQHRYVQTEVMAEFAPPLIRQLRLPPLPHDPRPLFLLYDRDDSSGRSNRE